MLSTQDVREDRDYQEWVESLDSTRLTALASQAGIPGWMTLTLFKLREQLAISLDAHAIYLTKVSKVAA